MPDLGPTLDRRALWLEQAQSVDLTMRIRSGLIFWKWKYIYVFLYYIIHILLLHIYYIIFHIIIIQYVSEESSFLTQHVQVLFSINSSFGNVPAHQYDRRFVLELTVFDFFRYRCRNKVLLHWGKEHTFLLDWKSLKLMVFQQFRDSLLRTFGFSKHPRNVPH